MNTISTLIIKKLQGVITPSEQAELEQFAAQSEKNGHLVAKLTNYDALLYQLKESYEWFSEEDLQYIEMIRAEKGEPVKVRHRWRALVVAVVLLLVCIILWYYFYAVY